MKILTAKQIMEYSHKGTKNTTKVLSGDNFYTNGCIAIAKGFDKNIDSHFNKSIVDIKDNFKLKRFIECAEYEIDTLEEKSIYTKITCKTLNLRTGKKEVESVMHVSSHYYRYMKKKKLDIKVCPREHVMVGFKNGVAVVIGLGIKMNQEVFENDLTVEQYLELQEKEKQEKKEQKERLIKYCKEMLVPTWYKQNEGALNMYLNCEMKLGKNEHNQYCIMVLCDIGKGEQWYPTHQISLCGAHTLSEQKMVAKIVLEELEQLRKSANNIDGTIEYLEWEVKSVMQLDDNGIGATIKTKYGELKNEGLYAGADRGNESEILIGYLAKKYDVEILDMKGIDIFEVEPITTEDEQIDMMEEVPDVQIEDKQETFILDYVKRNGLKIDALMYGLVNKKQSIIDLICNEFELEKINVEDIQIYGGNYNLEIEDENVYYEYSDAYKLALHRKTLAGAKDYFELYPLEEEGENLEDNNWDVLILENKNKDAIIVSHTWSEKHCCNCIKKIMVFKKGKAVIQDTEIKIKNKEEVVQVEKESTLEYNESKLQEINKVGIKKKIKELNSKIQVAITEGEIESAIYDVFPDAIEIMVDEELGFINFLPNMRYTGAKPTKKQLKEKDEHFKELKEIYGLDVTIFQSKDNRTTRINAGIGLVYIDTWNYEKNESHTIYEEEFIDEEGIKQDIHNIFENWRSKKQSTSWSISALRGKIRTTKNADNVDLANLYMEKLEEQLNIERMEEDTERLERKLEHIRYIYDTKDSVTLEMCIEKLRRIKLNIINKSLESRIEKEIEIYEKEKQKATEPEIANLTDMEIEFLNAMRKNCYSDILESGGEFYFAVTDELSYTTQQARGVATSLKKKGLIIENHYDGDHMLSFTDAGKKLFETATGESRGEDRPPLLAVRNKK